MRSFRFRLPVLVAAAWVGVASSVWALGRNRETIETVYAFPTTATAAVPTSYVMSSSWVLPTTSIAPTYYSTAFWSDPVVVPTTYVPTAYYRTGLFGRRRLVERPVIATYAPTYWPTSYTYTYPTTYRASSYTSTLLNDPMVVPSTYLASAADCICPPGTTASMPGPSSPSSGASSVRSQEVAPRVQSKAADESISSDVPPPSSGGATGSNTTGLQPAAEATNPNRPQLPQGGAIDSPPQPPPVREPTQPNPAAQRNQADQTGGAPANPAAGPRSDAAAAKSATRPNPGAAAAKSAEQPAANPPDPPPLAPSDLQPADGSGTTRSDSQKPVYSLRARQLDRRNILFGNVASRISGEPEEGVTVTLASQTNPTLRKTGMSDAYGRFRIRVPDGVWTVRVPSPSGRIYEVGQIVVNEGRITDTQGADVPSLIIER